MSEKNQDIEQRKKELKREIEELQQELDHSIEEARTDLSTRLRPKNLIRDYPLTSLGVVVVAGFLFGKGTAESDQKKTTRSKNSQSSSSSGNGLGSHIWSEIKRTATKRAVRVMMQYIDSAIAPSKQQED